MIDVVTVVYHQELPYLEIQAKSIENYVAHNQIGNIIVVVNDNIPIESVNRSWYGQYQEKLRVISYQDLSSQIILDGWDSQQICKLLASRFCSAEWSMILDAKTWFIRPFDLSMVLSDGKIKRHVNAVASHFSDEQKFLENYYGIDLSSCIRCGVPFYVHNKTCTDLIDSVDNFVDFFQKHVKNPPRITEFLLYISYVSHKQLTDTLYTNDYKFNDLNVADWQTEEFEERLAAAENDSTVITFGLHRLAYKQLSDSQVNSWLTFLHQRNLIDSVDLTKQKLNMYI